MRTVVLVGTDHKFQKPIDGPHRAGIENFRKTIRELFVQHELRAIAEEMNPAALQDANIQESVAQQLCIELGRVPHNFSDPARGKERCDLGIKGSNEIILEGQNLEWTNEQINAAICKSNRIREREWLRRIQEFDKWPVLFICGADHFSHFAKLLRETGISVIEAYQDWGPEIEVHSPTPLYRDANLHRAGSLTCLSKLKLTEAKQLLPREKVTVKKTVCGKDFWAFEIETGDKTEGWVLDVQEGIHIIYPAR